MELRSYQKQILDELAHLPAAALFMGTGTGKTITAINKVKQNKTGKLLIICPKNVTTQWELTLRDEFPDLKPLKFNKSDTAAKKNDKLLTETYDIVIINFDIVTKMTNLQTRINNNWTIIVDESHRIKSMGTRNSPVKSTRAVLALSNKTKHKLILTATPTQGNYGGYIDYYSQLYFLGYLTMSYKAFTDRYTIQVEEHYGNSPYPVKTIVGYKNTDEIDNLLKKVSKRYIAKAGDFPPEHIKVMLNKPPSYDKLLQNKSYNDILITNLSQKRIALKTLLGGCITGYNAFGTQYNYNDNTNKIDWLREFIEDTNERIVIFYRYNVEKKMLEGLLNELGKKYIVINGDTKDKYLEVKKEWDIVIGQYQAMSEALDGLQHKSHIEIFYSMPESSISYVQALGRIDRIGQTDVPMYYYLITENTIEEQIYKLIEQKVEFSEEILDRLCV